MSESESAKMPASEASSVDPRIQASVPTSVSPSAADATLGMTPAVCRPAPPIPLSNLPSSHIGLVLEVAGEDADLARLKALGICQGRRVQMVQTGDPMIVRVLGTRVGLAARLAAVVTVEPCQEC